MRKGSSKGKKRKKANETAPSMDQNQFLANCCPALRKFYVEFKKTVADRKKHKHIFAFHDNARYYTSNIVQECFEKKDTYVPVYPSGGYYGKKLGFPAKRFIFLKKKCVFANFENKGQI